MVNGLHGQLVHGQLVHGQLVNKWQMTSPAIMSFTLAFLKIKKTNIYKSLFILDNFGAFDKWPTVSSLKYNKFMAVIHLFHVK